MFIESSCSSIRRSAGPKGYARRGRLNSRRGAQIRPQDARPAQDLPRRLRPGAERRAAGGRAGGHGPDPGHRRRRLGEDPHPRLPRFAPDRVGARPFPHPPADLHQPGRARDAAPGRGAPLRRHAAAHGRDVPLGRQPAAAPLRAPPGPTANFTILDPEDARELLEAATSDKNIPTLERRFPKGDVLLDLTPTRSTPGALSEVLRGARAALRPARAEIVSVFQRYRERKRLGNAWTTTTCCLMWKRLLDEVEAAAQLPGLRPRPRRRVPGHQPPPGRHRGRHGRVKKNVMVVGDDAQAIYSFRGAVLREHPGVPAALSRRRRPFA